MKTIRALIAAAWAATACGPDGDSPANLRSNPDWGEAVVTQQDGFRSVDNAEPRSLFEVRTARWPVDNTRLLFWGDQAVTRDGEGYSFAAAGEDHEILMFDPWLNYLGALAPQGRDGARLQRPLTVSAGPDGRLAAFEGSGTLTLFDRWGREFRRLETPFAYAVGVWGPGRKLILARSPYTVPFTFEPEDPPLLYSIVPGEAEAIRGIGSAYEATQTVYTHAANAGGVTHDGDGAIYYAALARPEVQKYSSNGSRLWVSRRTVSYDTPQPRLIPNANGAPRLLLPTVQRAIAVGPDGLLYVRTVADSSGSSDRLDVLDPGSGVWLRSAPLDTGTAILVGRGGAVWEVARAALLSEHTRARREFPSFTLQTFKGDTLALEDLRGKVALVAFWASWCGPCRDELPHLDSLAAAFPRTDFTVVGISEDVNEREARSFADELGLEITLLEGKGRMRQRYHYSGLPYSVLLDRDGRIVREYYGFGGRESFDVEVAGRVQAELARFEPGEENHRHPHSRGIPSPGQHPHSGQAPPELTGSELKDLASYLPTARDLNPASGPSIPVEHWEVVRAGLALVDQDVNGFIERYPGTIELVQLMALKTQLRVDLDRLPRLNEPAKFAEDWQRHLQSIHFLLQAHTQLAVRDSS